MMSILARIDVLSEIESELFDFQEFKRFGQRNFSGKSVMTPIADRGNLRCLSASLRELTLLSFLKMPWRDRGLRLIAYNTKLYSTGVPVSFTCVMSEFKNLFAMKLVSSPKNL